MFYIIFILFNLFIYIYTFLAGMCYYPLAIGAIVIESSNLKAAFLVSCCLALGGSI